MNNKIKKIKNINYFFKISNELIYRILFYLDLKDLINVYNSSKFFHQFIVRNIIARPNTANA